jgi:hypothetical protein
MKSPHADNIYIGWDFEDIWLEDYGYEMNKGYPLLRRCVTIDAVPSSPAKPTPIDQNNDADYGVVTWKMNYNEQYSNSPTGFLISFGTDNPPTNIVESFDVGYRSIYEIKDVIDHNTTYYWQVTPYNEFGTSEDTPVWSFTTLSKEDCMFAGGFGTEVNPWQVETAEHLNMIRDFTYNENCYIQIADIDLGVPPWNEGEGWEPIPFFYGKYDGGGHYINGLTIVSGDYTRDATGLFFALHRAEVKNLYLKDVFITGESDTMCGLAYAATESRVVNCHVSGQIIPIDESTEICGLINSMYLSTMDRCSNSANLVSEYTAAGLVNSSDKSEISNSFNRGDLTGYGVTGFIKTVYSSSCNPENATSYVANSYSIGKHNYIDDNFYRSPLISSGDIIPTHNYWDMERTGVYKDNEEINKYRIGGEGRTTEEMTYPYGENTYVGWDFDNIWKHDYDHSKNDGYPYLWEEIDLSADKSNIAKPLPMSLRNFPNPFNPETTISFNLPKASEVELSIYNIKGQLVERVINRPMDAGQHIISWNGNDVSSGLYFYKLTTPEGSLINKMMLLK